MSKLTFKYLIISFTALCITSCLTRSRFNLLDEQRPYNYEMAAQAVKDLREGLLLVSIPTDHRKIQLLEMVVASDKGTSSKKQELEKAKAEISRTREHFITYFHRFYTFSDFQLLDDTLVRSYLNRDVVKVPADLLVEGELTVQRDTSSTLFVCRANRDFDDLAIYSDLGKPIAAPFPSGSQLSSGGIDAVSTDFLSGVLEKSEIGHAVLILTKKLERFLLATE